MVRPASYFRRGTGLASRAATRRARSAPYASRQRATASGGADGDDGSEAGIAFARARDNQDESARYAGL